MSGNFSFKNGFKNFAEKTAEEFRQKLNLRPYEPLSSIQLSEYLGISIKFPIDIFKNECESLLHLNSSNEWSALTLEINPQEILIIHNPSHSRARQESNIMHEIAHILCKHSPPDKSLLNGVGILMRIYNEEQEKEAEWLGSCLQLPRKALLWSLGKQLTPGEISQHFNASSEMVRFRLNITGVKKQIKC